MWSLKGGGRLGERFQFQTVNRFPGGRSRLIRGGIPGGILVQSRPCSHFPPSIIRYLFMTDNSLAPGDTQSMYDPCRSNEEIFIH